MDLTKSLGLKPTLLYKDESETVAFKNVVVPSSMRSPLWKYFGFPANENREIITKLKIICCICYNQVAYNKNTTNLATHLSHKHPEQYAKLNTKRKLEDTHSDASTAPKQAKDELSVNWYSNNGVKSSMLDEKRLAHPTGIDHKTYVRGKKGIYKPKFQMTEVMEDQTESEHDSGNEFIETVHSFMNSDIDMAESGSELIEVLQTEPTESPTRSKDEFISAQYITIDANNQVFYEGSPKKVLITTKSQLGESCSSKSTLSKLPSTSTNTRIANTSKVESRDSDDVLRQIKRFLIKDIVTTDIVDGTGFREMITSFTQNDEIPSSSEIDESIEKDYNQQRTKAISTVKQVIRNRNYSLLFHKLGHSPIVQISVNYWLDGDDRISSLQDQIFCISKNCTNFVLSFQESLSNCTAFLVDFDLQEELGDSVQDDLLSEIPIIPTFSYVTKMAMEACMQLSAIQSAVEIADETLGGKIKASRTWLQKFECMSQFLNEPQYSSDNIGNSQIIQVLVECLQPLKNCMDVLAFETSAYASIMKPVALQLINQHYSESDESIETDIAVLEKDLKETIVKVFQQHIIENPFLAMASFLDPRFQSLTAPNDLKAIRAELEKSMHDDDIRMLENRGNELKPKLDKSFGLSSLFSNLSSAKKPKQPKNRFDIEFRSYTEDVSLDMELCPLEWWMQNESLYPSIKQHVKKYFCVPSFVNNLHRLSVAEQEELECKYDGFENESTDEKMLWLHLSALR